MFAEDVVYQHYDRARAGVGDQPVEDQQLAGAVDEDRRRLFLWAIVIYVFFKTLRASSRRVARLPPRDHDADAEIIGHDEVPLTTADVEREFARVPATPEPD